MRVTELEDARIIHSRTRMIVAFSGLSALYLVSRLAFLLRLPPFIDEATHLLWAQEMLQGNLTAGAYDGRWATIQIFALSSLFPLEPLLIARLVIVVAGLFTLAAIVLSAIELFSMDEGIIAGLLYIVFPFALFFDRLALADGLSLAFGAWTFYVSILAARSSKGYYSVILTFVMLGAILTKTSGIVTVIFPLAAVAILLPRDRWITALIRVAPAVVAGLIVILALWIGGAGSSRFFEKTSSGSLLDLGNILRNTATAVSWYWFLLTPIMAVLTLGALIWLSIRDGIREVWFLESILLLLLLPNLLFYTIWYPRYLLFTLIPICILLARFLSSVCKSLMSGPRPSKLGAAAFILFLVAAMGILAYFDFSIIFKPSNAPLAERMRWQYIENWPSGYGVAELVDFLTGEEAASEDGVYVMRFFNWDQAHQGVNLALLTQKNEYDAQGLTFIDTLEPEMLERSAERLIPTKRTFIVLDRANSEAVAILEDFHSLMEAHDIWSYTRPGGTKGLEVWEVMALLPDSNMGDPTE